MRHWAPILIAPVLALLLAGPAAAEPQVMRLVVSPSPAEPGATLAGATLALTFRLHNPDKTPLAAGTVLVHVAGKELERIATPALPPGQGAQVTGKITLPAGLDGVVTVELSVPGAAKPAATARLRITAAPLPSRETFTITVTTSGSGTGTVGGAGTYPAGTQVNLTATPHTDMAFTAWSGACSGTQRTCRVKVISDLTVGAEFGALPILVIDIPRFFRPFPTPGGFPPYRKYGPGTVSDAANAIRCEFSAMNNAPLSLSRSAHCLFHLTPGTVVTLTATTPAPFVFDGWTGGGCSGTGTCTLTFTSGRIGVVAKFR